ncbi:MAG: hypothetical protein E6K80_02645 [Candidatus Eisenbacteria bacterium]|uniref:Uncharacterized protein n=1 Tax=Eiseniibacteriota bacterium TaxID=2212470 RepID=A0A538U9I2_UNCEI|nr:MAG: hypothetical protein E6K80_02645 [Candidatus Eisenbacteria bacterium]
MIRARREPAPGLEPAPLTHPATLLTVLAAAISILVSVSFAIFDPDLFQHLVVGKAIWLLHAVPSATSGRGRATACARCCPRGSSARCCGRSGPSAA